MHAAGDYIELMTRCCTRGCTDSALVSTHAVIQTQILPGLSAFFNRRAKKVMEAYAQQCSTGVATHIAHQKCGDHYWLWWIWV